MEKQKEQDKFAKYSDAIEASVGDTIYVNKTIAYTIDEYLSQGMFGKVFKVSNKHKPKAAPLACKVQSVQFGRESTIHQMLSHKHIVKYVNSYCSRQYCFLFMEYCKNGTLGDLVYQREGLTVFESRYFFNQINLGVKYLHEKKIVHRDLKLNNIFLARNMQVKIGDFGLAKSMNALRKRKNKAEQNKNHNIAPELFKDGNYSAASDIWAEGVILYKMVFFQGPFRISEKFLAASQYKFVFDLDNNDDLYDSLENIFQPVQSRFDAEMCQNSSFLCNSKIPKKLPDSILLEPIDEVTDSDPSYEP